jgi:hypothetical protein
MELPTAQKKSKQIFFVQLKVHQYKFRDEHGHLDYIRSAKQDDNYGASNIVLPCPGS